MSVPRTVRIKHLKKDGSVDPQEYSPVIDELRKGKAVIIPIDGVFGIARCVSDAEDEQENYNEGELVFSDFAHLDRYVSITKKQYDFLKRVWPDEVTVVLPSKEFPDRIVHTRIPVSPVSHAMIEKSGGVLNFVQLVDAKRKSIYKAADIEKIAAEYGYWTFIIDEWCKNHPAPTIIDIRDGILHLMHAGKVSIDEISSLYFLGSTEEN
jgi:tRNA A37 threonylcarbamoyladenosine synthetase subunit TsaC/SUA5/YrdC